MKGPFKKQVIILISNDNKTKFMKLSSFYITNFNRALKNIKSEVMADFVQLEQAGITIVTNKVILPLDLQTIERYIKMSQTLFSLYLHNQWTDFHKLSCAGKPQMRAICTYVGCTKAITNN